MRGSSRTHPRTTATSIDQGIATAPLPVGCATPVVPPANAVGVVANVLTVAKFALGLATPTTAGTPPSTGAGATVKAAPHVGGGAEVDEPAIADVMANSLID